MNNKERIMRNLEYISGGMVAMKIACGNRECNKIYYQLMDNWYETIWDTINLIEEDYKNAENS